jgi:hypothetical protein
LIAVVVVAAFVLLVVAWLALQTLGGASPKQTVPAAGTWIS